MKMMKINGRQRGVGGNYYSPSCLLTPSASAIKWQSTETPSPFSADITMSGPTATRATAAACAQNEGRGALDAAAAMRSNGPENQPAFAAARVKHTAQASSGRSSAVHSTARAPLQPHLHFPHATPRHTLHYRPFLFPAIRRPVEHDHTGRRCDQSTARSRTLRALAHTGKTRRACNRGAAAVPPGADLAIAARRTTPRLS